MFPWQNDQLLFITRCLMVFLELSFLLFYYSNRSHGTVCTTTCKGRNYCIPRDPASWEKMAAIPDDCERTATVALPTAASSGFISGEVGISASPIAGVGNLIWGSGKLDEKSKQFSHAQEWGVQSLRRDDLQSLSILLRYPLVYILQIELTESETDCKGVGEE